MNGLLLALLSMLVLQVNPNPTGMATGVVLSSNGMPAASVRVFAIRAGDTDVVTADSAVFESLAETDATGHFRLEAPVGRYYIAAGSVTAPTYFPDTPFIASAKVILITAGTTVESVNFSRYVLPTISVGGFGGPTLPPGSTGVLSGIVRSSDGTPESGVHVIAAPVTPKTAGGGTHGVTDVTGRYRIENVSPDTYNLVAGLSDSAVFYPATITTTPTTTNDTLNFTMPAISKSTIRGRVSALAGRPAGGADVLLTRVDPIPAGAAELLPRRTFPGVTSGGDGTFEVTDVVPGTYTLQARIAGTDAIRKSLVVGDKPMESDFAFPIHVVAGRILWEDGTPVSDPLFKEVAVSTASNPNYVATTVLPVSANGIFSGVAEPDDYRFLFLDLPAEFPIRSIMSGTTDLLKENLHIAGDVSVDVEVRLAKNETGVPRVAGKVVDAITGGPSTSERVKLCCFDSGPYHQLSARVHADGSFGFSEIREGSYTAALQGRNLKLVDSAVDVGSQKSSNVTLVSSAQLVSVMATFALDGDAKLPPDSTATVTLTSQSAPFHVTTTERTDAQFWFYVPAGIRYSIAVTALPAGYKVKSISTGPEVFLGTAASSIPRIVISVEPQ